MRAEPTKEVFIKRRGTLRKTVMLFRQSQGLSLSQASRTVKRQSIVGSLLKRNGKEPGIVAEKERH
jgi:hypothetical protein